MLHPIAFFLAMLNFRYYIIEKTWRLSISPGGKDGIVFLEHDIKIYVILHKTVGVAK